MLLRIRITSFLAGFGLAGGAALWQLRQDVQKSHEFLAEQARRRPTARAQRRRCLPAARRRLPLRLPRAPLQRLEACRLLAALCGRGGGARAFLVRPVTATTSACRGI
jgi:hypothetical protein